MKKTISIFLCLILALYALPLSAFAAEDEGSQPDSPGEFYTQETIWYNPVYADAFTREELDALAAENAGSGIMLRSISGYVGTLAEAASQLKAGLKAHQTSITVKWAIPTAEFEGHESEMIETPWEEALKVTPEGREGDYIRFTVMGIHTSSSWSYSEDHALVTLNYNVTYAGTTGEQEEQLSNAVDAAISSFGFTAKTSGYDKIRTIYNYIASNVRYASAEHVSVPLYHSAYSAMFNHEAVCQGYASLLYYMLWRCQIPCRIVDGQGNGGPHAWNLVWLRGQWYSLDVTWDQNPTPWHDHFLRGRSTGFYGTGIGDTHAPDNARSADLINASASADYGDRKPVDNGNCAAHSYASTTYATDDGCTCCWCSACGQSAIAISGAPVLQGTSIVNGVVQVKWLPVTGATKYYVFRRTNGGGWVQLGYVLSTGYLDSAVSNGNTYTYTVRAYVGGKLGEYDETGVSIDYVAPVLQSAAAVSGGIQVKWQAVPGASKYVVFRKTGSGSWVQLANASAASYLDKAVSNGTSYTYTVRAMVGGVLSGYDTVGISATYAPAAPAAPVLQSVGIVEGVVQLKWKTVTGAAKYRVFRSTNGGQWETIGYATSTAYLDRTVVNGNTYTYTVRSVAANGTLSGFDAAGLSIQYIAPVLQGTAIVNGVVQVKWKAVSGASKYLVFRKTGSGSWVQLGSATGTSYLDKTVTNGNTYTYTVRAMVGGVLSGYDPAGTSVKYLAPVLQSAVITNGVTQLKWQAVAGASKYIVFRKTNSGSWVQIGSAVGTSYQDKNIVIRNTYTYTVRAVVGGVMSGYNTEGIMVAYIAPVLLGVNPASGGIEVNWVSISGATRYYVFRKTNDGSWEQLGYVSSAATRYTDSSIISGNTYTYTVRAMIGGILSGYDPYGVSIHYI